MSPAAAAGSAGLCCGAALWVAARRVAPARLRRLLGSDPPLAGAASRAAPAAGCALAGVLALLALGRVALVASAVGGLLLAARAGRVRAAARREQRRCAAALPRLADLLAACVAVGLPPPEALDVVRRAVGGPLALRLAPVVSALRLGADPVEAYRRGCGGGSQRAAPADRPDATLALVRALDAAMTRGTPLVEAAARVADDVRRQRRWAAEAAARRAGVLAVGPLMLCHLPAFVLVGVVPLVVGVARSALGDLG